MSFYRKKPIVIEAIQFTGSGDSCAEVADFLGGYGGENAHWEPTTYQGGFIHTLEGEMEFRPGDWIIRGVNGEFYPIKDEIFRKTYEPVTETEAGK